MDPLDNSTNPSDIGMQPVKHHSYRMILITLLVILVGIGGVVVLSNTALKSKVKEEMNLTPTGTSATVENEVEVPVASVIADRADSWVEIVQPTREAVTVGQEVTVDVLASSAGKDITGYDVLLYVDRAMFDIVSITSDLPNFSIYQFDKDSHLTVTGIKDLQDQAPSIFDNTTLLKLVLRPKQAGVGSVGLYKTEGKEKTQFVDTQVTVIEPQIGSSQITIQ